MRKLAPLFATLLLLATASLATAQETVPHNQLSIQEGRVTLDGTASDPRGPFTFEGAGLTLTGELYDGNVNPLCPCQGGSEVEVRTTFGGDQSIRAGTFTIGGASRDVYYAGHLTFDGNRITLPTRYTRRPFSITFPITLQGNLQVHRFNPFSNPTGLLFDFPVNLQGTATLTLKLWFISPTSGRPMYRFQSLTYDFSSLDKAQDN